jgi:inosine-uridine nucleoside N-ribohydrolase
LKRVIIDTDPGIDDTAAIFLALSHGSLQVEVITTVYGNVNVEQSTRNALKILEVAGHTDIPVYQGAERPLVRKPNFATFVHGENGLGDITVTAAKASRASGHAVEAIISHVMNAPGEITLLALGPMTNVALALSQEPVRCKNPDQNNLLEKVIASTD